MFYGLDGVTTENVLTLSVYILWQVHQCLTCVMELMQIVFGLHFRQQRAELNICRHVMLPRRYQMMLSRSNKLDWNKFLLKSRCNNAGGNLTSFVAICHNVNISRGPPFTTSKSSMLLRMKPQISMSLYSSSQVKSTIGCSSLFQNRLYTDLLLNSGRLILFLVITIQVSNHLDTFYINSAIRWFG